MGKTNISAILCSYSRPQSPPAEISTLLDFLKSNFAAFIPLPAGDVDSHHFARRILMMKNNVFCYQHNHPSCFDHKEVLIGCGEKRKRNQRGRNLAARDRKENRALASQDLICSYEGMSWKNDIYSGNMVDGDWLIAKFLYSSIQWASF